MNALLSRGEAAALLGVRPQTLAVWACTGRHKLPFLKVGGAVRYSRAALEKWLAERERTQTT